MEARSERTLQAPYCSVHHYVPGLLLWSVGWMTVNEGVNSSQNVGASIQAEVKMQYTDVLCCTSLIRAKNLYLSYVLQWDQQIDSYIVRYQIWV